MTDDGKMSFLEHLEELRVRLIRSALAVFVGMIVCWFFRDQILAFLLAPLYEAWRQVDGLPEPQPLNFSSMLEPFIAYLKMAAIGGVFIGAPVILYQLWQFIAPGLYPRERRLALPFVAVSSLLFVGGSVMAYSVVFPIGFRFFLDFASGNEAAELTVDVVIADVPRNQAKPDRAAGPPQRAIRFRDGGVPDSGADGDAVTPDSPVPHAGDPAPSADVKPWYERWIGNLLGQSCAVFDAVPTPDGAGATLTLRWHKARCGEVPSLDTLQRNGAPVEVVWKSVSTADPGYAMVSATDQPGEGGAHTYALSVPKNPGQKQLAPVLMVKDYLSFAVRLLLAFGLIFELPILISFLSLAGIVNYKQLIRFSRWFLVISVIMGAMLTPPDVITQILLAAPLMVLYFLSIVFAYLFGPKVEE
ncbi:MAG: twin-arginine translocase subunit TatC [Myxococcota bacterium]|nr:twin-arginine translocase subunit TatC [Myxococcota bacterium]